MDKLPRCAHPAGLHGPLEPCVCGINTAGVHKCACPTSFPAPSAMGAAFNTSLYWLIGHHDGIEARAINNCRNHASQNNYGDGIDYWCGGSARVVLGYSARVVLGYSTRV